MTGVAVPGFELQVSSKDARRLLPQFQVPGSEFQLPQQSAGVNGRATNYLRCDITFFHVQTSNRVNSRFKILNSHPFFCHREAHQGRGEPGARLLHTGAVRSDTFGHWTLDIGLILPAAECIPTYHRIRLDLSLRPQMWKQCHPGEQLQYR